MCAYTRLRQAGIPQYMASSVREQAQRIKQPTVKTSMSSRCGFQLSCAWIGHEAPGSDPERSAAERS